MLRISKERSPRERNQSKSIPDKSSVVQPRHIRSPHGKRPLPPDISVQEQGNRILPHGRARPTRTLRREELEPVRVLAQHRGHRGFHLTLHLHAPAVREHPARDEVVVVGLDGAGAEHEFVGEGVLEGWREDRSPDQARAARDAEYAAVGGVAGLHLEVVPGEVQAAHVVPEAGVPALEDVVEEGVSGVCGGWREMLDPLSCSDEAYAGVIEGGEGLVEPGGCPGSGIVGGDDDGGVGMGEASHDLVAFAGHASVDGLDVIDDRCAREIVVELVCGGTCLVCWTEGGEEAIHIFRSRFCVGREDDPSRRVGQYGS